MPPKTKSEVAAADQEIDQNPDAVLDLTNPSDVDLNIAHPVKHDGVTYGPGDVTVTADLAETFRALGVVTE